MLLASLLILLTAYVMASESASAQTEYNLQVGASGDEASRGNMGVGVEIRTNSYLVSSGFWHAFWVGDNLANGAFIQFGYQLQHNYLCLYGERVGDYNYCKGSPDHIGYRDARWFWQYWPDPHVVDFYYADGPANSAGSDGSWHLYQILATANGWSFVLDGKTVWNFNNFKSTESRDPAFMVAEEGAYTPYASGSLGPVEFRNLSYLDASMSWQKVTSLSAISGCGLISPNCGSIPYGVTLLGANHIIAGTGQQLRQRDEQIWPINALSVNTPSINTDLQQFVTATRLHQIARPILGLLLIAGVIFLVVKGAKSVSRHLSRKQDSKIKRLHVESGRYITTPTVPVQQPIKVRSKTSTFVILALICFLPVLGLEYYVFTPSISVPFTLTESLTSTPSQPSSLLVYSTYLTTTCQYCLYSFVTQTYSSYIEATSVYAFISTSTGVKRVSPYAVSAGWSIASIVIATILALVALFYLTQYHKPKAEAKVGS